MARLYHLSTALARAATHEAVAAAVLEQGVPALGASGGGVLLATNSDRLLVPGTVGYDEHLVDRLREESPQAELPAAVALRTGQPVWIESRDERDRRFPELAELERRTVSMCGAAGHRRHPPGRSAVQLPEAPAGPAGLAIAGILELRSRRSRWAARCWASSTG